MGEVGVMPYSLTDMALYFFMYSFCGWLMETVLCSFQEKRFVNRGFLNGPFCPIYGCGIVLILIFLLPVRDGIDKLWVAVPVIFAAGAFLASVVEYFTSWLMEKLFHARWWDYSTHKFNLNGRICLDTSLAWGVLSILLVYLIQPGLAALVGMLYGLSAVLPPILAALCGAAFVVDVVFSVKAAVSLSVKLEQMEKLGDLVKAIREGMELPSAADLELKLEAAYDRFLGKKRGWTAGLRNKAEELRDLGREEVVVRLRQKMDELSEKRADLMGQLKGSHRRLLRAFPTMKRGGGSRLLDELRESLRRHKK